jgi:formyl-CoA transferase
MPTATEGPAGPLAGVRVVEFAQALAIPVCGMLLADMGAEVIKVEPPGGDAMRLNQEPIIPGESKGFTVMNRGKKSVCIDVSHPGAAVAIDRLAATADVVLMALKPSDLPRYNLTYERFAAINPAVIFLEHSAYGTEGPMAEMGGYDVVVQGMSGLASISSHATGDVPQNLRPAYSDLGSGYLATLGVVAALRHRDATGEGQRVRTSLLGTALHLGLNALNWFAVTDAPRHETLAAALAELRARGGGFGEQRALYIRHLDAGRYGNIYFRHYRTADGFISVGCLSPGLEKRFRDATGLPDPRLRPGFDLNRSEDWDEVTASIRRAEDLFRTRTNGDWIATLRAGGVPCGVLNFPHEIYSDPQIAANGLIIELEHELLGPYRTIAPPVQMDRTPLAVRGSSPLLGVDTIDVLRAAGLSVDEVAAMLQSGAVGPASREGQVS